MDFESSRQSNFDLIKLRISHIAGSLNIDESEIQSLFPHLFSDKGYE